MSSVHKFNVTKLLGEDIIGAALCVAYYAHSNQLRKDGKPYIVHPLRVAEYVITAGYNVPDVIAAALLHDVIEESEITLEELSEYFPESVVGLVGTLTKFKHESMEDYMRKIKESDSYFAKAIKLADVLNNLETVDALPKERRERFLREVEEFYLPLCNEIPNGVWFAKRMMEAYNKYAKASISSTFN